MDKKRHMKRRHDESVAVKEQALRLITELVNQEHEKNNSIDNRANICACLIGILITILISVSSSLFMNKDFSPSIILWFAYASAFVALIITFICSMLVLRIKQRDTISPSIVEMIVRKSKKDALRFEIKWKKWEQEQLNTYNQAKLYRLHQTVTGIMLSSIYLLLIVVFTLANQRIVLLQSKNWFSLLEYSLGIMMIITCFHFNALLKHFSFWKD